MSRHVRGPMSEDLELRQIAGPARYTSRTDKTVDYIAIADQRDVVIAYIYANDEDGAAGFLSLATASIEAQNCASPWVMKLREAKARGAKPTVALDEMLQAHTNPEDPRTHVVGTTRRTAPSLVALRELAGFPRESA